MNDELLIKKEIYQKKLEKIKKEIKLYNIKYDIAVTNIENNQEKLEILNKDLKDYLKINNLYHEKRTILKNKLRINILIILVILFISSISLNIYLGVFLIIPFLKIVIDIEDYLIKTNRCRYLKLKYDNIDILKDKIDFFKDDIKRYESYKKEFRKEIKYYLEEEYQYNLRLKYLKEISNYLTNNDIEDLNLVDTVSEMREYKNKLMRKRENNGKNV